MALDDRQVLLYLMRAGMYAVLKGVAEVRPPLPVAVARAHERRGSANPLLIQVTQLRVDTDLRDVPDRIAGVLQARLAYPRPQSLDIARAVAEAANNFEHGGVPYGFLAMQVYGQGRFLEIGVSDHGKGIAASLRRNDRYAAARSDAEAITLATRRGVSEFDELERGRGLPDLLELVARHGGSSRIRSGTAAVTHRPGRAPAIAAVGSLPGVHVAMTLPAK